MQLFDWNIAAVSNNSAPPDGAPENMEYSAVNNTMREMMAVLARYFQNSVSGTKVTTGTQPAYVLTTDYSLGAYAEGQIFAFTAHATSTGAVTLNVDGEGAGNVVDARGQQLGSGDIRNGGFYVVRRTSGGTFMVLGALAGASIATAAGVTLNQAYSAGGTGNALTITTGILTAYANGQMIAFRATANNTGAATINIDGLGAEALEDYRSAALSADDIQNGRAYIAVRTGGEWRILCGLPIDLANDVIGTLPLGNGGTGQTTASAAFGALKQAATESATGVVELATTAEIYAATTGDKALCAQDVEEASAFVTMTDAATISFDWDAGICRSVTLTANRVLGNPTNGQPGTFRHVLVNGNDGTDRTLTFGNQFLGEVPTITDADSGRAYLLSIVCINSSHFAVSSKRVLG